MSDQWRTPPPQQAGAGDLLVTPEQIRRIVRCLRPLFGVRTCSQVSQEEDRLKAKALRVQHEAAQRTAHPAATLESHTSFGFAIGQKRPHTAITTMSNTGPNQRDASQSKGLPSPRHAGGGVPRPVDDILAARKFTKFVEYDFSKMTDTKGGFLTVEDDPHNKALHTPNQEEKPTHMTLREWDRHQLLKKLREQRAGPFEPGLSVLKREGTRACQECGALEIDWKWEEVFSCRVCSTCKEKLPDKYSLLTKTEAREDYLLTDPELKDPDLLPHLDRPNPHKATWNNMQLYLRYQVEEYAFSSKKWGSPEKLDEEFAKREAEKKRRKEEKFKAKLLDLKKRTRVDAYKRGKVASGGEFGDRIERRGDRHEHEWGIPLENAEGATVKQCIECGMEIEELEF